MKPKTYLESRDRALSDEINNLFIVKWIWIRMRITMLPSGRRRRPSRVKDRAWYQRIGLMRKFVCTHLIAWSWMLGGRTLGSKLKIPVKNIFDCLKIGNQNFYYIKVIVFYLCYLPIWYNRSSGFRFLDGHKWFYGNFQLWSKFSPT